MDIADEFMQAWKLFFIQLSIDRINGVYDFKKFTI